MNLAEVRFRAQELAGLVESETGLDTSPGDIDRYINSAYRMVLSHMPWRFLEAELPVETVQGQVDYEPQGLAAGATVGRVRGIWMQVGDRISRLRPRPRVAFDDARLVEGVPAEYSVMPPRQVRLYPPPERDYLLAVAVTLRPPPLVEDVDVPVFDEDFHDLLADSAASAILRRRRSDGDVGRANDLDATFADKVSRMVREDQGDHDRVAMVMGGREERRRHPAHGRESR